MTTPNPPEGRMTETMTAADVTYIEKRGGGRMRHVCMTTNPTPGAPTFTVAPEGACIVTAQSSAATAGDIGPSATAGVPDAGTSTTFTIAPRLCAICREPLTDGPLAFRRAHDHCLRCPECHADFVVWQTAAPAILRCLNCLHRWEGKP